MPNQTPASKRIYSISEISCPDSCNQPAVERGCHFRAGPDSFTCTKCHLKIWRHFMGYELTPTDLQEMLHGDKITSSPKALVWKKNGKEAALLARLVLNEDYKVRLAPKLKSKRPTDELCPQCKTGKLQLITAVNDSQWFGCENFPKCRFTKPFIPHRFNPEPIGRETADPKADVPETVQNRQRHSGSPETRKQRKENNQNPATTVANCPLPAPPFIATPEPTVPAPRDYRRIPHFILRMLKIDPLGKPVK